VLQLRRWHNLGFRGGFCGVKRADFRRVSYTQSRPTLHSLSTSASSTLIDTIHWPYTLRLFRGSKQQLRHLQFRCPRHKRKTRRRCHSTGQISRYKDDQDRCICCGCAKDLTPSRIRQETQAEAEHAREQCDEADSSITIRHKVEAGDCSYKFHRCDQCTYDSDCLFEVPKTKVSCVVFRVVPGLALKM
jgi:hypothetical protein